MHSQLSRLHTLIKELPDGLQHHLHRTRDTALELAARHNVDPAKVELAALGHDLLRAVDGEHLLHEARALALPVHPVEERVPILLHGLLAAQRLKRDCSITDPEVLEAVQWHSTSCAGMGPVGLVVFLADKLDPHKIEGNPQLQRLAAVAQESLERAAADYLTGELTSLLERGSLIHPASVEARNYLIRYA